MLKDLLRVEVERFPPPSFTFEPIYVTAFTPNNNIGINMKILVWLLLPSQSYSRHI